MAVYEIAKDKPFSGWVSDKIINEDRIDGYYYDHRFIEFEEKMNNSEFEILKLGEMFKNITDGDHDKREYIAKTGIAFYSVKDICEFEINNENVMFIARKDHDRLKRSQLEPLDLLITKTGRVGTSAVVPKKFTEGNISADVAILKGKKVNIDEHYLVTYLNSKYGQLAVIRLNYGSTRARITLKDLPKVKVLKPPSQIQKYIGDKVRKAEKLRDEANNLNLLCENQIKKVLNLSEGESLYNNNAGNKSLEYNEYPIKNYVNPRNISNRLDPQSYHPELYETLEKIKKLNCKYVKLRELLEEYSTGKSSPTYVDNGLQILMTKNIKNNTINWDCKEVDRNSINQSAMINKEDLLITTYGGPSIGKVDILFEEKLCTFDYTILKMKFNESCNPYFMTMLLRSKFVQNQIRYLIKGTTGITFVIPNEILDIAIPIIDKDTQDKIGEVYKKSLDNIKTSKILIQQAKQDIEDLIEGNFDTSKIKEINQD